MILEVFSNLNDSMIFFRCCLALVLQDLVNSFTLISSTTIQDVLLWWQIPSRRIHRKCSRTCEWQELLWSLPKSYTILIPQDVPALGNIFIWLPLCLVEAVITIYWYLTKRSDPRSPCCAGWFTEKKKISAPK